MSFGALALIVIGPKDLPKALKTVGKWVRRAKDMAREFQSGVDEMVPGDIATAKAFGKRIALATTRFA